MQKRIRIGLTAFLLLMVGVTGWEVLSQREPVYQGKRLSVWLVQYGTNHFPTVRDVPLGKQAETTIRKIGTNAIPTYLKMITTGESPFKLRLMALVGDRWLARFHVRSVFDYRPLGAFGLIALGEEAKSAIPTLIVLLKDKEEGLRFWAGFTLEELGPAAGDALLPFVKQLLNDPDVTVQEEAIRILSHVRQAPERVIPVLIEILAQPQDPQHSVRTRTEAIRALRYFGEQAKPAVPNLVELLGDQDAVIRSAVTNALRKIDPESATNAGVKWPSQE